MKLTRRSMLLSIEAQPVSLTTIRSCFPNALVPVKPAQPIYGYIELHFIGSIDPSHSPSWEFSHSAYIQFIHCDLQSTQELRGTQQQQLSSDYSPYLLQVRVLISDWIVNLYYIKSGFIVGKFSKQHSLFRCFCFQYLKKATRQTLDPMVNQYTRSTQSMLYGHSDVS